MSYALAAPHCQPLIVASGGGGTECDPYTKPAPAGIVTVLNFTPPAQVPTAVVTVLCAPVS